MFEDISAFTNECGELPAPGSDTSIGRTAQHIIKALKKVSVHVKSGYRTRKLASIAYEYLKASRVDSNSIIICISPEDVAWHGMPGSRIIKEGEIVTVDIACSLKGYWADMAYTFPVGRIDAKRKNLLEAALKGTRLISKNLSVEKWQTASDKIQQHCHKYNVRVIPEAAGHGIGRRLHDEPKLAYVGHQHETVISGRYYTAEPVFTSGNGQISISEDGSFVTVDKEPAAHFELTVLALMQSSLICGLSC